MTQFDNTEIWHAMKQTDNRSRVVLMVLSGAFCFLIAAFSFEWWGAPRRLPEIPLVDLGFLKTETWRKSYADLIRLEEDVDHFDCYICHEEDKKSVLKFDANHRVIIPEEHEDIVMGHGSHGRNNDCFNCHNDKNLLLLSREQWYQDLRHGYARGFEAKRYVENIRSYYEILKWMDTRDHPLLVAQVF